MSDTVLLVLCNVPDADTGHRLAHMLVERQLAACVNLLPPCTSIYRWQGKLETASEHPLLIKTTTRRYPALEAALAEAHPYELPEILAFQATTGLSGYLGWVAAETAADDALPDGL